jgi:4-amino-4-deoxy-L-arabinose transferase-like glycosyltransferase
MQQGFAPAFVAKHYWLLASAVLAIAAFNLTFRLGHELVVEWDESLYGLSAWEMLHNRQWIGTTFRGSLDYYNTKPPLNIWLISLAFNAFGPNLITLRLPSIISAWLTVAVLQEWTRRALGPVVALLASLVLATSFGFLYDHAARNATTDALFTFLVLLTIVTLWASRDRPWRLLWLGPLVAAAFLLRGMGVLMPLAIVAIVETTRRGAWAQRRYQFLVAALIAAAPIGAWVWARWQLDGWRFLAPLFTYDFVARSFKVIEGHHGTIFYHLNVLQKNQLEWLIVGITAWASFPPRWPSLATALPSWRRSEAPHLVLGAWAAVTFLMPTLMRTKLSWYLNPFYPVFAVCLAWVLARGLMSTDAQRRARRRLVTVMIVLAVVAIEARLLWYSTHRRSLARSTQGFLLAERHHLQGRRIFRSHWDNGELFILAALAGAEAREVWDVDDFVGQSSPGDYWLSRRQIDHVALVLADSDGRHWLYRRVE